MRKKYYIILLLIISILVVIPNIAAASTAAETSKDGDRTITLLYSGDLHGNIRPVSE